MLELVKSLYGRNDDAEIYLARRTGTDHTFEGYRAAVVQAQDRDFKLRYHVRPVSGDNRVDALRKLLKVVEQEAERRLLLLDEEEEAEDSVVPSTDEEERNREARYYGGKKTGKIAAPSKKANESKVVAKGKDKVRAPNNQPEDYPGPPPAPDRTAKFKGKGKAPVLYLSSENDVPKARTLRSDKSGPSKVRAAVQDKEQQETSGSDGEESEDPLRPPSCGAKKLSRTSNARASRENANDEVSEPGGRAKGKGKRN